jgi:hypothetical protein
MTADIFLQKQQEQRERGSQRHDPRLPGRVGEFNLNKRLCCKFAVDAVPDDWRRNLRVLPRRDPRRRHTAGSSRSTSASLA